MRAVRQGINTEDGNGASLSGSTGGASAAGVWDLDVVINPQTSIACVELPYFSKERPLQGTKAARVRPVSMSGGPRALHGASVLTRAVEVRRTR